MRRAALLALFTLFAAASAQLRSPLRPPPVVRDTKVLTYVNLSPTVTSDATPLLFSDSPERPTEPGVLYRDTVTGTARVVAYHVNGLGRPARLMVLTRGVGAGDVRIRTLRRGSATTGPDPVIGQQTLLRYFASRPLPPRSLAPGEIGVLYSTAPLAPNVVTSVMLDFEVSGATEVTVLIVPATPRPSPSALLALPALARDAHHQRGTFIGANRSLDVTLPAGTARVTLGGAPDLPLRGRDALTGDEQTLLGNFGVLYTVRVRGASGRTLGFSTRGGRYRGLLSVRDGERHATRLVGQRRALTDPAALPLLWSARTDTLDVQFVPANGSNLPAALVFYPVTAAEVRTAPGRSPTLTSTAAGLDDAPPSSRPR